MTDGALMFASSKTLVRKGRTGREENQIGTFAHFAFFADKKLFRVISNH